MSKVAVVVGALRDSGSVADCSGGFSTLLVAVTLFCDWLLSESELQPTNTDANTSAGIIYIADIHRRLIGILSLSMWLSSSSISPR